MRIAFDWDGTLVDHKVKPRYDDSAHLKAHTVPHVAALARAKRLIQAGYEVHIVTGRGPHVREVTLNQARLFLDPDFQDGRLWMQPSWRGYDVLRSFKADVLCLIKPALYVGDHQCDLGAASDAKVPFMEAESWRRGHAMPKALVELVT